MENNLEDIFVENSTFNTNKDTLFGSPWRTDQEIYDFVKEKKDLQWSWEGIKEYLMAQGIPNDYAEAIIENSKEAVLQETGTSKSSGRLLLFILGIVIFFIGLVACSTHAIRLTPRLIMLWLGGTIYLCVKGASRR